MKNDGETEGKVGYSRIMCQVLYRLGFALGSCFFFDLIPLCFLKWGATGCFLCRFFEGKKSASDSTETGG